MIHRLRHWLRAIFGRGGLEREMREEMAGHLERATERLAARGLSPQEARRAANLEFGNVDYLKERARDARGGRWVDEVRSDVRYAFTTFRRMPLVNVLLVVILALGIGANAAVFTVMYSAVTMPPPGIQRDDALVRIRGLVTREAGVGGRSARGTSTRGISPEELRAYRALTDVFTAVEAWAPARDVLEVGAPPAPITVSVQYVTPGFFAALGVEPVVGSLGMLPASADGIVIDHGIWARYYGLSPEVVGRSVRVGGRPATIVGVAPPRFHGVAGGGREVIWRPLADRPETADGDPGLVNAVARLAPGVTPGRATLPVEQIARSMGAPVAVGGTRPWADVAPLLADNVRPGSLQANLQEIGLVGAVTLLVLLITCTSVCALLAAAASARQREIAVRLSLGAPRGRIVKQLLTESVLRALAGAVAGSAIVWLVVALLESRSASVALEMNGATLLFTSALAVVVGVVVGLAPALHGTRLAVADCLKTAAPSLTVSRMGLRKSLVVAQIALSQPLLVLVALVALLTGEQWRSLGADGVNERIVALTFDALGADSRSAEATAESVHRVATRVEGLPGVEAVVTRAGGYGYQVMRASILDEDRAAGSRGLPENVTLRLEHAPEGYFELMQMSVVRGRDFLADEREPSASLAIVVGADEARDLWGDADPVGRRLVSASDDREVTIVGVVESRRGALTPVGTGEDMVTAFVPRTRGTPTQLYVRTRDAGDRLIPLIRAAAYNEAPQLRVLDARTLAEEAAEGRALLARLAGGAAAAAVVAMLLCATALYGLVWAEVGQRVREVGIRVALGARRGDVLRRFLGYGARLGVAGLALGLSAGAIVLRIAAWWVEIPVVPWWGAAAVSTTSVLAVVVLATWVPAWRAARTDPQAALRSE